MVKVTDKAEYMRQYRREYRRTTEGRAKILAGRKRWKKSELGKQRAREHAKRKYSAHPVTKKTPDEINARRRRYWKMTAAPKRMRKHRENMDHLKRYGLTKEQYLEMMEAQRSGCAICGGSSGSSRNRRVLCVDHCHHTGKIRGLLCDNCNKGIGCLKDDVGLVRKALLYLEAHHE